MILELNGLVSGSDMFEEVTQTLSPKDRRSLRSIDDALRVHVLTEFGKNPCYPIDSAGSVHISDKIDRRRFNRRDKNRSARIVEALHRHDTHVPARDEGHLDGTARDCRPVLLKDNLEFLRTIADASTHATSA